MHRTPTALLRPSPQTEALRDVVAELIAVPGRGALLGRALTGWQDKVEPAKSTEDGAMLVRPDGYLAWADGDVNEALTRWFGSR